MQDIINSISDIPSVCLRTCWYLSVDDLELSCLTPISELAHSTLKLLDGMVLLKLAVLELIYMYSTGIYTEAKAQAHIRRLTEILSLYSNEATQTRLGFSASDCVLPNISKRGVLATGTPIVLCSEDLV